ncbi:MAG: hypothetical protein MI919_04490 [Holophagales bacterium]|nr:hypothetical protein [Holophagales bacterium]
MSWTKILKPAAGIAGGLLTAYSESAAAASFSGDLVASTFTGDIEWGQESTGNYVAINRGNVTTRLAFSQTPSDSSPETDAVTLEPGFFADVSEQLRAFNSGNVCVGRANDSEGATEASDGKILSAGFTYLALNAVATINDGLSIAYYVSVDGNGYCTITADEPPVGEWTVNVQTTDGQGGSVGVDAVLTRGNSVGGSGSDAWQWTINLPPGVDLNPLVEQCDVSVTVEEDEFQTLTEKSRRRARRFPH